MEPKNDLFTLNPESLPKDVFVFLSNLRILLAQKKSLFMITKFLAKKTLVLISSIEEEKVGERLTQIITVSLIAFLQAKHEFFKSVEVVFTGVILGCAKKLGQKFPRLFDQIIALAFSLSKEKLKSADYEKIARILGSVFKKIFWAARRGLACQAPTGFSEESFDLLGQYTGFSDAEIANFKKAFIYHFNKPVSLLNKIYMFFLN